VDTFESPEPQLIASMEQQIQCREEGTRSNKTRPERIGILLTWNIKNVFRFFHSFAREASNFYCLSKSTGTAEFLARLLMMLAMLREKFNGE
jgi:hypothetical protein